MQTPFGNFDFRSHGDHPAFHRKAGGPRFSAIKHQKIHIAFESSPPITTDKGGISVNKKVRRATTLDELLDFCSLEELAGLFQVSWATVYRMAEREQIPCLRIGRRIIVSREHLRRWVDESIPAAANQ